MGYRSLYSAVHAEDLSEVNRLLSDKTTDKNKKNDNGWTPIILAADLGNENIVQKLIAVKEVNINAVSDKGRTAVYQATRGRYWHIVRVLVRHNAIVYIETEDHETALQYAVRNGQNMITSLLLRKGAGRTINAAETNRGDTALHMAVRKGSLYLCRKLAMSMNSKNIVNGDGETAWDLAKRLKRSQKIIDAVEDL